MDPNWHAQLMVDEINKQSERDASFKGNPRYSFYKCKKHLNRNLL